jgi:hypothetical protein
MFEWPPRLAPPDTIQARLARHQTPGIPEGAAVADLPFDLTDPPDLPPKDVRHAMLWRVAICLFRAHSPGFPAGVLVRCRVCGHVWPCPGRRLAERALIEACGPATAAGDA